MRILAHSGTATTGMHHAQNEHRRAYARQVQQSGAIANLPALKIGPLISVWVETWRKAPEVGGSHSL